jgi:hypothetical protein
MSLPPLRPSFGDFAGGLEHAVALATLAYATARPTGLRWLEPSHPALMDSGYPVDRRERDQRLVQVLQMLLNDATCSLDDLRREGFPEEVLLLLGVPTATDEALTAPVLPSA